MFAHEPLPADSLLWTLPKVIATPHSAGFSDGNAARVAGIFLDNLRRWQAGEGLRNLACLSWQAGYRAVIRKRDTPRAGVAKRRGEVRQEERVLSTDTTQSLHVHVDPGLH